MQGIITIMIILIFVPVGFSIYVLYKRLHEEPKDNKAREILLQAMCLEELKKKKGADTSSVNKKVSEIITDAQNDTICQKQCESDNRQEVPDTDDDIKKAMSIAKETLHSQDDQRKNDEEEKASKKKAADMVLNMMINKGKNGASREELQEMINVLSDKNK